MRAFDIIEKKRDGNKLNYEELKYFVEGYCSGIIPDYQASAFLMASFLKGLDEEETTLLTKVMMNSGDKVDLSSIPGVKVDKHSTGGVGDKTTLVLGPIVAACGIPVAKMSGRGLGHTGGTIDKLESIPGFNVNLSINSFLDNVRNIGIAIAGQTGNLVPADKKLYALRDVTATVNSIPLIASSIMSKKLASGADAIVLDVKTGKGAFMKTLEESKKLAKTMVDIGNRLGSKTIAVITGMDNPLGYAVGNSLEVIEVIETLKGHGPEDLKSVSLELAARMLMLAGNGNYEKCKELAQNALDEGKALDKFREMLIAQGGNANVIDDYSLFPQPVEKEFIASQNEGWIESIEAHYIGLASMRLGAGRETKESTIDYSSGIRLIKKPGDFVKAGEALAEIYTSKSNGIEEAKEMIAQAYAYSDIKPVEKPLIYNVIE